MEHETIFDFVATQKNAYLLPICVFDDYEWSMYDHIRKTVFYKNSLFTKGANDGSRPFKNLLRMILNTQYRTEGFDLKDIELWIDDYKNYYKSFLLRKYHSKWGRENHIDTFIDEMVESYVDFGGALVKKVKSVKPEVVPLQSLAFCDQADILSAPFGIKHYFNPQQLLNMANKGWGDESNGATATLDDVVFLMKQQKADLASGKTSDSPGNYIELYEVHGVMPNSFLDEDNEKYSQQMQIIVFDKKQGKDEKKSGSILYRKREPDGLFKMLKRDPIYNRALGFGGGEELFEDQVWTNYSEIKMKEMMDSAAKTILKTTDKNIVARHPKGAKDMENLEFLVVDEGKDVGQLDTVPRSINLFDRWSQEKELHAQKIGGATDALLGQSPSSGTPFRLQERVVYEGKGVHEYRQGKIATFTDEIYMDWVIPDLAREVSKEQTFSADLDFNEMQEIVESVVINEANKFVIEKILNGDLVDEAVVEQKKQEIRASFMRNSKKFIKIIEGEMKKAPVGVKVNIAGKQKDLVGMTDKLTNVFRQIMAAPQILENPQMAKIFNQILETSGLSPVDFGGFKAPVQQPQQPLAINQQQNAI